MLEEVTLNPLLLKERKRKDGGGRKKEINPLMLEEILSFSRQGIPQRRIAEKLGISVSTVYRYYHLHHKTDQLYCRFCGKPLEIESKNQKHHPECKEKKDRIQHWFYRHRHQGPIRLSDLLFYLALQ